MKKKLLLLITIFLLTGCKATYNINFSDTITDEITITESNDKVSSSTQAEIDETYEKMSSFERGHDYYNREKYVTSEETGYQYTYDFTYDEYDAMSQLRKCYEDFNFTYDQNITLKTSNEFLCYNYYDDVDEVEINITSKYTITSSNADEVENNKYTWLINKNNYKNKPIEFSINKNEESSSSSTEEESSNKNLKIYLTFGIFIILIFILLKLKNKTK